jgi:hypothetical protein
MLTRIGKLEATKLGFDIAQRYQGLSTLEKVWMSTAERTVNSAKAPAGGLADDASDVEIVQISEGKEEDANSLTPMKVVLRIAAPPGVIKLWYILPPRRLKLQANTINRNINKFTLNPQPHASTSLLPLSTSPPVIFTLCSSSAATRP